jgi:two-component system chemotaxis response regulator CheY
MSMNVLIVDDSATVRAVLEKTLRLANIPTTSVHHAGNGAEALELLNSNQIDIVFADLNMPVMNGLQMIMKLYEQGRLKTLPVIVVSTEGGRQRIDRLLQLGIAGYVRKPFHPEDVRGAVDHVSEVQHVA